MHIRLLKESKTSMYFKSTLPADCLPGIGLLEFARREAKIPLESIAVIIEYQAELGEKKYVVSGTLELLSNLAEKIGGCIGNNSNWVLYAQEGGTYGIKDDIALEDITPDMLMAEAKRCYA